MVVRVNDLTRKPTRRGTLLATDAFRERRKPSVFPNHVVNDLPSPLDAVWAELDDLRHLYATFHHGWNHEPWTTAVLDHYRRLAPLTSEVSA